MFACVLSRTFSFYFDAYAYAYAVMHITAISVPLSSLDDQLVLTHPDISSVSEVML